MTEWNETSTNLNIIIPIPYRIESNKINHLITENFIKLNINSTDFKLIKVFDLFEIIIPEESKVIVEETKIIFYLKKLNEAIWGNFEYKSKNKEEINLRRKISEDKYNKKLLEEENLAKNKKKEFEKFVIDKSIKIEEEKRKELNQKKKEEKSEVENDLYKFVDEIEKKNEKVEEIIQPKYFIIKESLKNSEIFDKKTIKNENISEPSVRQNMNINVNLTEKKIAHFAARESMFKDPPYPKTKKYVPEKNFVINY